jgi:dTDP-glucose 4,6-dehydratase
VTIFQIYVVRYNILTNLQDKRVLVTGGAGFIGSETVNQLLNQGYLVTVFDNFSSGKMHYLPKENKNLSIIKGDITNESAVIKATKNQEAIIHLAALPFIPDSFYYPVDFFKVNTVGSMNVFWSAVKSKTVDVVVNISTSEVYGSAQYSPMDENHPTSPFSTYAVSKLAADRAAFTLHKENGFPSIVIRPFNTYGPKFTEPYIIPEILSQLLRGNKELNLGNVNSTRDFTFVSDTVSGILKAMQGKKAIGEIINIGSANEIRIGDLVTKLSKIMKVKTRIKRDESRLRPYDVNRLVCNNKKAQKLLNWKPTISIDKGLKITFDWAKKNKVIFNAPFTRFYYKNLG